MADAVQCCNASAGDCEPKLAIVNLFCARKQRKNRSKCKLRVAALLPGSRPFMLVQQHSVTCADDHGAPSVHFETSFGVVLNRSLRSVISASGSILAWITVVLFDASASFSALPISPGPSTQLPLPPQSSANVSKRGDWISAPSRRPP